MGRSDPWPDEVLARLEEAAALPKAQPCVSDEKPSPEWGFRSILLDLRTEILERDISQKELILKNQTALLKLKQEIRDLRYALLLGASRKERRNKRTSAFKLLR